MKKQQIPLKNSLILLLTATIWGIAFVAQSEGGEAVGPLTFNATRNIIGSLVLIPVILLLNKINPQSNSADSAESDRQSMASSGSNPFSRNKTLIAGGIICGICLCLASNFQQFGIQYTSVGKAGFLTACYIIIVPILGLFMKKFSFGDEEKIRSGRKLVKTALFSYAFILGIDLILSAIESLI